MKSIRHLVALCGLSGVVCLTVLVADASRLWLAAGPSLLAVLDAAAFSSLGRRAARHLSPAPLAHLLHGWSLSEVAGVGGRVVLLPVVGLVAAIAAFVLSAWSWWAAVPVALLAATILLRYGLLVFRDRRPAAREEETGSVFGPVVITGRSSAGKAHSRADSSARSAPDSVAMLAALLKSAHAARLVILALHLPEALSGEFDSWLAHARDTAMFATRDEGADPVFCEIGAAGPGRRVVAADSRTRTVLLALLHTGPPFPVLAGTATYPEDARTPDALIDIAFARAAPLRNEG